MLMRITRRMHRGERGSIVVAMLVLMVLTLLVTAVMARSIGNQRSVSRDQQYDSALATADGGMSDAYFRIINGATTTFTEDAPFGDGTYEYTATKVSDNEWTVTSSGTVNGVEHRIQATVVAGVLYPFALFTNQSIDINGLGTGCCTSYNSTTGATNTGHAWLGSNGNISCHGVNGDAQVYYTPTGSQSGCTNPLQEPGPFELADPVLPASTQACPAGGTFPSTINGQSGLTFDCSGQDIEFSTSSATTVSNGPVIIYVDGTGSVDLSDASINQTGNAAHFRILVNGPLDVDLGNRVARWGMRGVLYAPQSDLVANGCKFTPDGSVVVNSYRCNGGPHMDVRYDESLLEVTGAWVTEDWHEVASS